jgi:putative peptidoglycan binding protein
MPRRRRGAKAAALDGEERNFALRILLHSPKDTAAGAVAAAIVIAVIANALFLQAGRHPAPMFGSAIAIPGAASGSANPLPRPRPVEADASQPDSRQAETRAADPLAGTVKPTNAVPVVAVVPRPPATIPVAHTDPTSRRVAAVQRALTEYGYGQLKPTGVMGSDTQAAIQKFERTRKLPVTGQVSDRLVRELTAMIGHSIE